MNAMRCGGVLRVPLFQKMKAQAMAAVESCKLT